MRRFRLRIPQSRGRALIAGIAGAITLTMGAATAALIVHSAQSREVSGTTTTSTTSPTATSAPSSESSTSPSGSPEPSASTGVSTAAPQISREKAEAISGTFAVRIKVVDGNPNVPAGTTFRRTVTLASDCSGESCTLSLDGSRATFRGGVLRFSGSVIQDCVKGGGKSRVNWSMTLRPQWGGAPGSRPITGFGATERLTAPNPKTCGADTVNDPIEEIWIGVRK
jgi:hypothetical protein